METVKAGDNAPGFTLPASGGEALSLEDMKGKTVVLYFYPKDDTAGCTKQAIAFSEHIGDFEAAGAVVVGVSKDAVRNHDKFIAKHGLAVTLVSDAEGELCAAYGVWVEKSMYGRKYMGVERTTFVIDSGGAIRKIFPKIQVAQHPEAVLEMAQML